MGDDLCRVWAADRVLFARRQFVIYRWLFGFSGERYGGKALVLARFMPVIRTFTPITAGIGAMHYPTFWGYNLVGGLLWTVSLTLLGFFLGQVIPEVDRYLLPIVMAIVVVSVAPSALHLWQARRASKRTTQRRKKLRGEKD